jgi:hypothetical protein
MIVTTMINIHNDKKYQEDDTPLNLCIARSVTWFDFLHDLSVQDDEWRAY